MALNKNKQIVTVAVITYQSSATVIETLDSILGQTYGSENIELIISDDGSTDNTVNVITEWLKLHQDKFYCVMFFANKINNGIPRNCNIAWKAATSAWIKTIAGDDVLVSNALIDLVNYKDKNKHKNLGCIFGLIKKFPGNDDSVFPKKTSFAQGFFNADPFQQFKMLLIGNVPNAPASFINKNALEKIGYADECFKLIEDYPLWLKLTKNGFRLALVNSLVVNYRVSESVSMSSKKAINFKLNNEIRLCLIKHGKSENLLTRSLIGIDAFITLVNDVIVFYVLFNKKTIITESLKMLSPLNICRKVRLFVYWVNNC